MKKNTPLLPILIFGILFTSIANSALAQNTNTDINAILRRLDALEQTVTELTDELNSTSSRTVRITDGALPGTFSLSDNTKVYFSMGNLQYHPKSAQWRFAKKQHSIAGNANSKASATSDRWMDLFGWGTSGYHNSSDKENTAYQPYATSIKPDSSNTHNLHGYGPSTNAKGTDLFGIGANYDWGVNNSISNGGNKKGQWRTPTKDEWIYLIEKRQTRVTCNLGIVNARYILSTVAGTRGMILFPDTYTMPDGIILPELFNFVSPYNDFTLNEQQWNEMEANGAVFLPAAGFRYANDIENIGADGFYWSASHTDENYAHCLYFNPEAITVSSTGIRYDGFAVRLVKNVK